MFNRIALWSGGVAVCLLCSIGTLADPAPQELTVDLLVVGGTESGCAAVVQAARMGITNIVLINDIEWVGGQFSSEALAAIDENREGSYDGTVPIPRSGLFREAIDRMELLNSNKYAGVSSPGNTRVLTTCLPSDAQQVFLDLLQPYETQGHITRYSGYYPTQALINVDGVTLEGAVFASTIPGGTSIIVHAGVTIDASEWGDTIQLSGAEYDFGPDLVSEYGEPQAPSSREDFPLTDMNPITYCQIVVEQTNNTPIPMPPGYDVRNFSVGAWSGLGFEQAYSSRRLVDHYTYPQIDHPDVILLNNPHVDYPLVPLPTNVVLALEALEPGASTNNIVDMTREQRQVIFDDAKQRSLGYLYYLQTVVHSNLTDKTHSFLRFALSDEFGTSDQLPPKPYVRESLRLNADYVVRQQDTMGRSSAGGTDHRAFARMMFHDAVMCWQFEYDFHPTRRTFSDGGDPAGPWYASFAGNRGFGNGGSGRAVFPLRALIPFRINGLLGAQKNLGYTSIVSSSLRLHDQCMAVGQAAGAAAAVALRHGVSVRELPWSADLMADLWDGLLQRDVGAMPVALWPFGDIPPEHDAFPAINQLAVRGLLPEGASDTSFNADDAPQDDWLSALSNSVVAVGYALPPDTLVPAPSTRGAAAIAVWSALASQQAPEWVRLSADDADLDGVLDSNDPLPFSTNTEYWVISLAEVEDGLPQTDVSTNTTWRGFNFTQNGAPVWFSYEQDSGDAYTTAGGYGWLADLSANTRLRGIYPETIRDTLVFTRYQDSWQCAVSNGTYDVFFCVGDAGYDQIGQNVTIEGVNVLSNLDTTAGLYCESNATVTVTDGFLTVTIGRPEGGANTTVNWLYFMAHGAAIEVPPDSLIPQPDDLNGLAFWVKADAGVTTNANGKVTAWADQSGRANHAAVTAAYEPDLVLSEPDLNGMPTLRFNGVNQYLSVANRILTNGVEGFTVIAMAKADVNDNPSIISIRTGGGNPFVQLDQDATGHSRFIVRNSIGVTANALGGVYTGIYGMYAGRLTKDNATAWTDQIFFSKTSADASATADFSGNTDLTSGDQFIGKVVSRYWDGDIAEVMIYERSLSESELKEIEQYLVSRYKNNCVGESVSAVDEVSGLAMWLRADACVFKDPYGKEIAEDLDVAQLWSDSSEGTHDVVGLDTPTFVEEVVNGLPAIGFSPSQADRYYLRDNPIATDPDQMVIFAVFRQEPGVTSQEMIFTHREADTQTQLIQASVNNGTDALLQIRGSGNHIINITAPGVLTNGEFSVVMYQFDVVNDHHAIAVNGGAEVVSTYDFGNQSFIAETQRVGYYYGGAYFTGFLAEMIVYEGVALTRDQKRAIGYYLEKKYDLDTGYAPLGTLILTQ